jgi:hypothetical protein
MPTFGIGGGALLHFVPAGTLRLRLRVSPRAAAAGRRQRFVFKAGFIAGGKRRSVSGARVRFAGRTKRTGANGRAAITAALRPGRYLASAKKRGLKTGRAVVRVRRR